MNFLKQIPSHWKHFPFWLMIALSSCGIPNLNQAPKAKKGVVDLTNWDLKNQGNIRLAGEWAFYWNQLLYPEDFQTDIQPEKTGFIPSASVWNNYRRASEALSGTGYATYRLRIIHVKPHVPLALKVTTASTAMRIYIDGENMYQAGVVGKTAGASKPAYCPDYVAFTPKNEKIDLVMQVSNFSHHQGGAWNTFTLGEHQNIKRQWIKDIGMDFFLAGTLLIMLLYHLVIYLLRKKDRSHLYFSIFSLFILFHILSIDNYLINFFVSLRWDWLVRLEFLSFYLSLPLFITYLLSVCPFPSSKKVLLTVWPVSLVFSGVVIFLPPMTFVQTDLIYELFSAIFATFGLIVIINACRKSLVGSYAFLLGYLAIFASFLNDTLFNNDIISTGFAFSYGLFTFIFCQTFLLSKRSIKSFEAVEQVKESLESKNEQINEQNEILQKINSELDFFVYRTSHDLRAPIASVMGLINISRPEQDRKVLDQYFDLQEQSLIKLDHFIKDILDYARNARMEVIPEEIDFEKLLQDVLLLHSHMENYQRIEKSLEVFQQDIFSNDTRRLHVIFNNLISNAIRYSNPYQSKPYVKIKVQVDKKEARITVEDNGLGIEAKHLDKIFDMFYRVSQGSTGSGLGLFIVRETVKKMNGSLRVDSSPNQGTSFYISLPNLGA